MTKSDRHNRSVHFKLTRKIRYCFFSVRERAVFYKSCDLIGTESGQYSPVWPAHSGRHPIRCVLSRLVRQAAFISKCFLHEVQPIHNLLILSLSLKSLQISFEMNFVVANYELLNGLSRGLTIVCNLMILLKKQLRKNKNTRYFFTITIN